MKKGLGMFFVGLLCLSVGMMCNWDTTCHCTDWLRGIVVIISITQILNVWSIYPHGWLISQVFMYVNITSPIERVFNQPGATNGTLQPTRGTDVYHMGVSNQK